MTLPWGGGSDSDSDSSIVTRIGGTEEDLGAGDDAVGGRGAVEEQRQPARVAQTLPPQLPQ